MSRRRVSAPLLLDELDLLDLSDLSDLGLPLGEPPSPSGTQASLMRPMR